MHTCMDASVHAWMQVCMHAHTQTYIHTRAHTHTHAHHTHTPSPLSSCFEALTLSFKQVVRMDKTPTSLNTSLQ